MHRSRSIGLIATAALLLGTPGASAQEGPLRLSLDDALRRALGQNPGILASRNDEGVADWDVRQAYGQWLPNVSANSRFSWQGTGEQTFGTLTTDDFGLVDQPSYYFSSWGLNLNQTISGSTLLAPGQARANRTATSARIRNEEASLALQVRQSYLQVLRTEEGVRLADQQLERARLNLRLAEGRERVGQASPLDTRQAEVNVGRAEVSLVQAEARLETARLRLLQAMGEDLDRPVELTSRFEVFAPDWEVDELYREALDANPALHQLRASQEAADHGVSMARSAYYPSLQLSASVSGFARQPSSTDFLVAQAQAQAQGQIEQCAALNELFTRLADPLPTQDCQRFAFTPEDRAAIESSNDAFPFDFTRQPPQAALTISVPVFQGLSRQRQLEEAQANRDDLRHQLREQELALRADLGAGMATLRAAYRSVQIEEGNQDVAAEQLRLAQERYRVGLSSFLELVEAETVRAEADQSFVDAVYAFHDALADLEALVGEPLRTP